MTALTALAQKYALLLFGLLGLAVVILFILCIILFVKINREKKRYDIFMGTSRRPPHNLEMKIQEYFDTAKGIEEKYDKLLDMVTDMDKTDKSKIQKVGLIRYNPFEEMGGNLCFALALLDGEDNGVVLNGIHSRTGSFTYAKPIEMGVSIYMLSDEEKQAVKMAQEQSYKPEHEKVVKVKFKPFFKASHLPKETSGFFGCQIKPFCQTQWPQNGMLKREQLGHFHTHGNMAVHRRRMTTRYIAGNDAGKPFLQVVSEGHDAAGQIRRV